MDVTKYVVFFMLFYTVHSDEYESCKTVVHLAYNIKDEIKSCWNFSDANWYGGGSEEDPKWPIQKHEGHSEEAPVVPGGNTGKSFSIDNRFWFNSQGFSLHVPMDVPLYIKSDPPNYPNPQFCLIAKNPENGPYFRSMRNRKPHLTYTQCYTLTPNLTQFFLDIRPNLFRLPKEIPDESFFTQPVWSTWPGLQFGKMDQTTVQGFADNIRRQLVKAEGNNFTDKIILRIGRGWESCMGEFQFKSTQFHDAGDMIKTLQSKNFIVLMRAHPFLSPKCESLANEAMYDSYVMMQKYNDPVLTNNEGEERLMSIDFDSWFSDRGPVEWLTERLKKLQNKLGFDSYYFEYGQTLFFDREATMRNSPVYYSKNYAEVASQFGNKVVVGVGIETQHLPLVVELEKKSISDWGSQGIAGVIPAVLKVGLAGYPFILPDPIGGGDATTQPDKKLLLRWIQLSALMPCMHFSWEFWQYTDDNLVNNAIAMIRLRRKFKDTILGLAKEATKTGAPIVRPVWWIAPNDIKAQEIDDQFLLGNDIMVAPVITAIDSRNVYFPENTAWKVASTNQIVKGPGTHTYAVAESELMYFERVYN